MVLSYATVYTARADIVSGLKSLADEYKNQTATESEVKEMLTTWKKNCPNLFLDIENNHDYDLVPRVQKLIGAKRTLIIQTLLNEMSEAQSFNK